MGKTLLELEQLYEDRKTRAKYE